MITVSRLELRVYFHTFFVFFVCVLFHQHTVPHLTCENCRRFFIIVSMKISKIDFNYNLENGRTSFNVFSELNSVRRKRSDFHPIRKPKKNTPFSIPSWEHTHTHVYISRERLVTPGAAVLRVTFDNRGFRLGRPAQRPLRLPGWRRPGEVVRSVRAPNRHPDCCYQTTGHSGRTSKEYGASAAPRRCRLFRTIRAGRGVCVLVRIDHILPSTYGYNVFFRVFRRGHDFCIRNLWIRTAL